MLHSEFALQMAINWSKWCFYNQYCSKRVNIFLWKKKQTKNQEGIWKHWVLTVPIYLSTPKTIYHLCFWKQQRSHFAAPLSADRRYHAAPMNIQNTVIKFHFHLNFAPIKIILFFGKIIGAATAAPVLALLHPYLELCSNVLPCIINNLQILVSVMLNM